MDLSRPFSDPWHIHISKRAVIFLEGSLLTVLPGDLRLKNASRTQLIVQRTIPGPVDFAFWLTDLRGSNAESNYGWTYRQRLVNWTDARSISMPKVWWHSDCVYFLVEP